MDLGQKRENQWQRRHFLSLLGAVPLLASRSALAKTLDASHAQTGGVDVLAAADLQAGMKGYGLTVVRGTKVERFDIEVIGVLQTAMPQQDLILIRCAGLGLEHAPARARRSESG